MSEPTDLHTKYRPKAFDQVVGQKSVVKSLLEALEKKLGRSFIFTGPAGVGKTTLARLIGSYLECSPGNIIEVDAASRSGVDGMKEITSLLLYNTIGESKNRVVILDEVQALSKQAWQSLLKSVEEPPPNVYWVFCTTEANKIPKTIESRCLTYELKPVKADTLFDLLKRVMEAEGIELDEDFVYYICQHCDGSPRRALTALSKCSACSTIKQVADLMKGSVDDGEAIELCRLLVKGASWAAAQKCLETLQGQNPESVRHVVQAYLTTAVMGAKTEDLAGRLLQLLDAFVEPYPTTDSLAPLILSVGRCVFQQ